VKEGISLKDIVYHGTISKYKRSLLSGINIDVCDENSDFGQGFYTTTNRHQALAFANYLKKKHNTRQEKLITIYPDYKPQYVNSLIVAYKINIELLNSQNGIIFDSPNDKWGEFIYNNRLGIDFLISDYHNIDRQYDYVYGQLADSAITTVVEDAKSNRIGINEFYQRIQPYSKYINQNQLSFHTENSLECLEMLEIEIIRSDKYEIKTETNGIIRH